MWCSHWTEILCGNVSWLEEHPLKILRDLHARFGRCFRTAGRRGRVVHVSWSFGTVGGHCRRALRHCRRGRLWDTGRLARAFLAKLCMVIAGME